MSYLPDDFLVKVDHAAMTVSLETPVPMLDHPLVEFAMSLPLGILHAEGPDHGPLRQLLYKYVPKDLIERPKMGFGASIESWLRGKLREWAEDLLSERRLKEGPSSTLHPFGLSGTNTCQHDGICSICYGMS